MSNDAHSQQVNRDEEHLRLLWKYHAALGLFQLALLLLFVILPLVTGTVSSEHNQGSRFLFHLITRSIVCFVVLLNGWSIRQKRHWLTCCFLSILECSTLVLHGDVSGTLLGCSSVLVLRRETVKQQFGSAQK